MSNRVFSAIMMSLLVLGTIGLVFNVQPVRASGTIYIRAEGSIDPPTAPIYTSDNITYTLTGNITADADGIVIERDNIVIDGNGYTVQGNQNGNGLNLTSISNVKIENTSIEDFQVGIFLYSSSRNNVSMNNAKANTYGIYLWHSSNNIVNEDNTTRNDRYGIYLEISSSNNVTGNSVTATNDGIYLSSSSSNNVTGNSVTATNDGIYLSSSSSNNVTGNSVTATNGGIHLEYSSNYNTISGNDATANTYGIYLSSSSNANTIRGNNITKNGYGILLNSSSTNAVSMNNATANTYGIYLNSSLNNIVSMNNAKANTYGIRLISSSINTMYYNNFLSNSFQANVSSTSLRNFWDEGYPSGGNYWSDYPGGDLKSGPNQDVTGPDGIGDTPYSIDANNKDQYPLYTPYPKQLSVFISPFSVIMHVDQHKLFNSTVSGGTSPTYQWYLNGTQVPGATNANWTFTPTSSSYNTVYLDVTDAVSAVTTTSNTVPVSVYGTLSLNISSVSQTIDVGQPLLFNSTVSNSTGTPSYQWYLNGTPIPGATNADWTFTPSSAGSPTVYLNVTDSASAVAKSNTVQVTVNEALSVSVTPRSVTIDAGQSQLFTSSVSGGTGSRKYQWYLDGTPKGTDPFWTFPPTSPGSYSVKLNVTDAASNVATSNATITVNRPPSVHITPATVTMDVVHSLLFSSSVYDGVPPYTYQWYLNSTPVSGANSSSWNFTSGSAGFYTVYLNSTDKALMQATFNTVNVTVVPGLVHNVAVTNVTTPNTGYSPMTTAAQGIVPVIINNLNITVTAKDLGTSAETFNVTVYANTRYIGSQVITLENNSLTVVTFAWNSSGFAYGNYTISASAEPVLGENNTADNNFTAGVVHVTIPGDINGDGKVSLADLVILASAYNSGPGDSKWNPNADINNNGAVGLSDLVIMARTYNPLG